MGKRIFSVLSSIFILSYVGELCFLIVTNNEEGLRLFGGITALVILGIIMLGVVGGIISWGFGKGETNE